MFAKKNLKKSIFEFSKTEKKLLALRKSENFQHIAFRFNRFESAENLASWVWNCAFSKRTFYCRLIISKILHSGRNHLLRLYLEAYCLPMYIMHMHLLMLRTAQKIDINIVQYGLKITLTRGFSLYLVFTQI